MMPTTTVEANRVKCLWRHRMVSCPVWWLWMKDTASCAVRWFWKCYPDRLFLCIWLCLAHEAPLTVVKSKMTHSMTLTLTHQRVPVGSVPGKSLSRRRVRRHINIHVIYTQHGTTKSMSQLVTWSLFTSCLIGIWQRKVFLCFYWDTKVCILKGVSIKSDLDLDPMSSATCTRIFTLQICMSSSSFWSSLPSTIPPLFSKRNECPFFFSALPSSTILHFLAAKGCGDLQVSKEAVVSRDGPDVKVYCNKTKETWYLTCKDNQWVGELGSCNETCCK